jgi:high-affinity K+ transport system ATPase subunit B
MTEPVHGVLLDATGTRVSANRDARTIKAADAADPANMADAADMRDSKSTNSTNATKVSAAAEAAHVGTSAEAATHTASVSAAASAAARIGLRNCQGRSQQGRRQNRDHFSHRLLHSVVGMLRATSRFRAHNLRCSGDRNSPSCNN